MRHSGSFVIGFVVAFTAALTSAQCVTTYSLPELFFASTPHPGPDGAVWFAMQKVADNSAVGRIGRIDKTGAIASFAIPGPSQPTDVAFDVNGDLWYTDARTSSVVQFSPAIGVRQQVQATLGGSPQKIVLGSDNNLWFTEQNAGKIGRLTPGGQLVEFSIPNSGSPIGIAVGSDGNLWFTTAQAIGKITLNGTVSLFTANNFPYLIAAGPDGNLWFTQRTGPKIVRATTSGAQTEFTVPNASILAGIVAGPDGRMWFTDEGGDKVGNVTTSGIVSILSAIVGRPGGIGAGPDGNMWISGQDQTGSGRLGVVRKIDLVHVGSPTILTIQPPFGSTFGGTAVEIHGSNFQETATVSFGGLPSASVVVSSAEILTATTPPHASGLVALAITNCDGHGHSPERLHLLWIVAPSVGQALAA